MNVRRAAGVIVAAAAAGLALAFGVAAAPSQGGGAIVAQPLHHTAQLAPLAPTTFTVTCPKGYAPSSGGVTAPVFGVVALKSYPTIGGGGWTPGDVVIRKQGPPLKRRCLQSTAYPST